MSRLTKDDRPRAAGPGSDEVWRIMKEVLGAKTFQDTCDLDSRGIPRDTHGKMPLSWANMHDIVKGLDKVMQQQNSQVYRLENQVETLERDLTLAVGALHLLLLVAPAHDHATLAKEFVSKRLDILEQVREEIFEALKQVVGEEAARASTEATFEAALREHLSV
jgi:hypothetical protein